jgi:hypothetical protein
MNPASICEHKREAIIPEKTNSSVTNEVIRYLQATNSIFTACTISRICPGLCEIPRAKVS